MKFRSCRFLLLLAALIVIRSSPAGAQSRACGPELGYEGADMDRIFYVGATCVFSELMGPISLRPHLSYGFGHYDWADELSGDYGAFRLGAVIFYPIEVSKTSPLVVYPLIGLGYLSWWEDCDFEDCSDSGVVLDFGAGATYNVLGLEIFAMSADYMDYGIRLRAAFDI